MFIGEYTHRIDDKGRLTLPTKFRAQLASGAVVTRGLDNSLFLYPLAEWKKLADKLAALPLSDPAARQFARLMLAGAMDVVPDRQGRISIPPYLRSYASLTGSVVVAGLYNRMEIWSEKSWNAFRDKTEKETDQIAEHLSNLGI